MTRNIRTMNSDVFINELLRRGIIRRVRRGWYIVPALDSGTRFRRGTILSRFGIEVEEGRFIFNEPIVRRYTPFDFIASDSDASDARRPLRTITRYSYQSQRRNVEEALERIPFDADGVRRSYGIEYEINSLSREEESELAYLLDTLPPHVTERDGSLSSSGVEIVFEPLGKEDAISVVKTLGEFVRRKGIDMRNTGMHITFGVSNSQVDTSDLIIRTNRLALAVKAAGLKTEIVKLFGRDFTNYARLPESLNDTIRHRAFRVRSRHCWENRLVTWNCDIERVMEFFSIAEVLFHRPFQAEDFMRVFELLGSSVGGN